MCPEDPPPLKKLKSDEIKEEEKQDLTLEVLEK